MSIFYNLRIKKFVPLGTELPNIVHLFCLERTHLTRRQFFLFKSCILHHECSDNWRFCSKHRSQFGVNLIKLRESSVYFTIVQHIQFVISSRRKMNIINGDSKNWHSKALSSGTVLYLTSGFLRNTQFDRVKSISHRQNTTRASSIYVALGPFNALAIIWTSNWTYQLQPGALLDSHWQPINPACLAVCGHPQIFSCYLRVKPPKRKTPKLAAWEVCGYHASTYVLR